MCFFPPREAASGQQLNGTFEGLFIENVQGKEAFVRVDEAHVPALASVTLHLRHAAFKQGPSHNSPNPPPRPPQSWLPCAMNS